MKENKFTHVDGAGNPKMVDVSDKSITKRTARAQSRIAVDNNILSLLKNDEIHTKKGPVFHTCIIAGVMAAKKTSDIIPFCHPIALDDCQISIHVEQNEIVIDCTAITTGKTGVEMEALTGASAAALTFYDMCKALSHDIVIKDTRLMSKTGGKKDFFR
ncbi:Molybdenum cofactor biosynthesis protein MoaC [Fulvivirga imtechensis AK7]|uniref:cyclic pyranopterin monophosphate synthase n=1 Tax=Fulvivirga imtechensis AK7 TaxID=1237149 RepID=L8JRN1_9BACT|nr:cyclic pyranopterin monophosphate synthase MoaC [Fulvivirga imtechensis]ELR70022.1 Molybdenum cofactor biosynthesis protein MoaC [Fulvivirga imtechensis AK7]